MAPTPAQVLTQVEALTGLSLLVEGQTASFLVVSHPLDPARSIDLNWSLDRLPKERQIAEALAGTYSISLS
ncbi:hypothetical protein [Hymenobacter crusticola]|uniref:hypothetical protein n=1 Tax=Hymenobacter crusticola TaxID=1770526 RepID=UPI001179B73A|nr:hypothetical protein [Hymenobacter crusticola]